MTQFQPLAFEEAAQQIQGSIHFSLCLCTLALQLLRNDAFRNQYTGIFGGHLSEAVALVKYNLDFDNLYDMNKLNASIAVELPFEEFTVGSIGGSFSVSSPNFRIH
jgi:hypothetical protein